MSRVQGACAAIAFVSVMGLLYDSSHGNLDIFWISSFVPWLGITLAATGASLQRGMLKSLKTALTSDAATSEDRERAALALETAGRLTHPAAAFVSLVAVVCVFQNLGSDIAAIGGSYARSILTMIYATVLSEFILAPLHTNVAPGTRWPQTMLLISGIFVLAVLASSGFGAFSCPSCSPSNTRAETSSLFIDHPRRAIVARVVDELRDPQTAKHLASD